MRKRKNKEKMIINCYLREKKEKELQVTCNAQRGGKKSGSSTLRRAYANWRRCSVL